MTLICYESTFLHGRETMPLISKIIIIKKNSCLEVPYITFYAILFQDYTIQDYYFYGKPLFRGRARTAEAKLFMWFGTSCTVSVQTTNTPTMLKSWVPFPRNASIAEVMGLHCLRWQKVWLRPGDYEGHVDNIIFIFIHPFHDPWCSMYRNILSQEKGDYSEQLWVFHTSNAAYLTKSSISIESDLSLKNSLEGSLHFASFVHCILTAVPGVIFVFPQ